MPDAHLTRSFAALIDGQFSPIELARANTHLADCDPCRHGLERVRMSANLLAQLPLVEAPASIWHAIEADLDRQPATNVAFQWLPVRAWAMAALLFLAVAGLVTWQTMGPLPRSDVARIDAAGGEAGMMLGEWIETGATSSARVRIGQIGTVDVGPNTRVQLLAARPDEHRLNLAHGSISVQIAAPPRLFFVETPASTVVDLGCAYTMDVDQSGVGVLRVTSGWASLEWAGRESVVPAGASCPTRPEIGPGTPSFDDASGELKSALTAFDFDGGGAGALAVVLREARGRDTLTLWHLLSRVEAADRPRVFDRLIELTPLPAGVTREKAMALDPATLQRWREELAWTW